LTCLTLLLALAAGRGIGQNNKAEEKLVLSEEEQKVLDLTNEERKKEKLPPLKPSLILFKAARKYAEVMAKADKATHDVDGTKPGQRVKAAGGDFELVTENVGYTFGGAAAKEMVRWWMESKGHRENILHKELTEIGLGAVKGKDDKIFYCQLFATPFKD
jgi:uncharacterized protein YkwD